MKLTTKLLPFLNRLFVLPVVFLALLSSCQNRWKALEDGFQTPPDSIRTAVYWYWLDNHISREGVVKDLEAMKRVGITRAFIGNQSEGDADGPVKLFSDEWWDITHTALKKAGELGIEIGMFNCPGWSQSGGPWVTPEQSMKYVEGHLQQVVGNGREQRLELPDVAPDRIIAVHAWRTIQGDSRTWTLKTREGVPAVLKMQVPFTVRSLVLNCDGEQWTPARLTLDGREVASFEYDRHNMGLNVGFKPLAPWVEGLTETPAGTYELWLEDPSDGTVEVTLSEIAYMPRYAEKTLAKMFQEPLPLWDTYLWDTPEYVNFRYCVDGITLQDLTGLLKDGELRWTVPDGPWTVLVSYVESTGVTNSPAVPEGTGLEVDKMNREHLAAHYDAFVGELLRRIPAEDRQTWKVVVEDSYETGGQNWTDDMARVFQDTYGYDPIRYLPVLQGFVVGTMDESERFLWDLRRLVADRVAYDYVGGLREKAHADGLETWLECYGHWGFPSEFLLYGSQSDQIAGEFWSEGTLGDIENRAASSCGHIYGKNRIWAESCTASGPPFNRYPRQMKQRVDRFFAEGINATLLHLYIQQPDDRQPGRDAWFGNEFNRNNAWFDGMGPFIEYLRRCNFMLQQGRYVADIAYFIGEDAPKMTGVTDPPLPAGYGFDYVNADVLRNHARVRNGRLVLDSGMEYRVLVLPKQETMRPEVLEAIAGFVREGLSIVGPAPTRSPSMQHGIFEADERVKKLAEEVWNGSGQGLVYPADTPLDKVLDDLGTRPDFSYTGDADLCFLHRTLGADGEIYFLSNQEEKQVSVQPAFRVDPALGAELWDPLTGAMCAWDGSSLTLEPLQSVFVVFRKNARSHASIQPQESTEARIDSPWTVEFAASAGNPAFTRTFDQLTDWTENADEAVRYYSGHAVYENTFTLPDGKGRRCILNLGEVLALARVKVNGRDAGGVWTFPYRLDITPFVKAGENTLEVTVYNNWRNRLIADEKLPEAERKTWTNNQPYGADDDLQPSGLLGPVTIGLVP
jgi:hypothetical protein